MRIPTALTTTAALALSLIVGVGTAASAAGPADPVRFELPAPTGRQSVGVTELHLVDRARTDPWVLNEPSWQSLRDHSTGWKRDLSLERGGHFSHTDAQTIVPALDERLDIPARQREQVIGTVDPGRSTAAQRAYLTASSTSTCGAGRAICWTGRPRPVPTCASSSRQ
ncbi:hypothetical protein [Streptomyces sp. PSAA01]|uniref:hypothetical protein n=1 Tax=Streptomyces sp. PSAA01 TaxID=2912762 RepID=UPI001F2C469D|nr:hypothetical protein [Streptomyces sp. PSAA01]MCG0285627.1 hypothetical protein [Streptomyces sp. PSAA01]